MDTSQTVLVVVGVIQLGLMVGIAIVGVALGVAGWWVNRKKKEEVPLFDDIPKPPPKP
jgi:hypothetical protein